MVVQISVRLSFCCCLDFMNYYSMYLHFPKRLQPPLFLTRRIKLLFSPQIIEVVAIYQFGLVIVLNHTHVFILIYIHYRIISAFYKNIVLIIEFADIFSERNWICDIYIDDIRSCRPATKTTILQRKKYKLYYVSILYCIKSYAHSKFSFPAPTSKWYLAMPRSSWA